MAHLVESAKDRIIMSRVFRGRHDPRSFLSRKSKVLHDLYRRSLERTVSWPRKFGGRLSFVEACG